MKSHALAENSNEHMDKLIGTANDVARDTRTSVLLAAHFRKGGEDGARDAIRGGSALIDGARLVRTLVPMAPAEAGAFKIAPDATFRYVRVNDAKANLAPKERATWIELASVPLGNREVNATYPAGDNVQAARAWNPPVAFDGIDLPTLERIFSRLQGAPAPGWFYSPEPRAKFWAGTVVIEEASKTREQAKSVLKAWLANGVFSKADYETPTRNDGIKIEVNDAKVAEMLAPIRSFDRGDE